MTKFAVWVAASIFVASHGAAQDPGGAFDQIDDSARQRSTKIVDFSINDSAMLQSTAARGAAQLGEERPRMGVSNVHQLVVVNRSYAESNVTSIEATASDISLEETTVHTSFCIMLAATAFSSDEYSQPFYWWCGNGRRRFDSRRRSWPDCVGDFDGCICGFNIDQPAGGSWAFNREKCDFTKCGWTEYPANSGKLRWRGSKHFLPEMSKCTLTGTY